jgi:prepilin-type N-terminal cleavage/methylation domain-containing protein
MKKEKGVTLVELMIVVGIISAVFTGFTVVLVKGLQLFQMNKTKAEVERDVRTVIELVNKGLREAESSTVVIDSVDGTQPPYSRISFTDVNGDAHAFYQNGKRLYMQTPTGSNVLMSNLRTIFFAYPDTADTATDESVILTVSLCAEGDYWGAQKKVYHMNLEKIRLMN